jgi:hypothetical protein
MVVNNGAAAGQVIFHVSNLPNLMEMELISLHILFSVMKYYFFLLPVGAQALNLLIIQTNMLLSKAN